LPEIDFFVLDPISTIGVADDARSRLFDPVERAVTGRGNDIRRRLRPKEFDGLKIEPTVIAGEDDVVDACGAVNGRSMGFEAFGRRHEKFGNYGAVLALHVKVDDAPFELATTREDGNDGGNARSEIDGIVADPTARIPMSEMVDVFLRAFFLVEAQGRDDGEDRRVTRGVGGRERD
jgi:hypothetical protein